MLPLDSSTQASVVQDSYLNQQGLNSIKALGRDQDPQAIKEVAKKFEAMFVQQMLKTMRDANDVFEQGSYFNSQESRFHRDMMDQQMVLNLTSGAGIGLATQFYNQMMRAYGHAVDKPTAVTGELDDVVRHDSASSAERVPTALDALMKAYIQETGDTGAPPSDMEPQDNSAHGMGLQGLGIPPMLMKPSAQSQRAISGSTKAGIADSPEQFVALLKPHAQKAAQELNISPDVLIAQVALETGWGKHVIHHKNGANSFNLFNIKAGSSWQGNKVNVSTLEYQGGVAAVEKADFRQYNDYAESFSDYVRLMKTSPRYQGVLESGKDSAAYAEALQSAGYATDPQYARKIKQLLNSDVIRGVRDFAQQVTGDTLSSTRTTVLSMAANAGRAIME